MYNIVQGYFPALRLAYQNINTQVAEMAFKAADVQIQEDVERQLKEEIQIKKRDSIYIQKIIQEGSRDLMTLLDRYQPEKCLINLKRCIEYCQNNPSVREASHQLLRQ